MRSERSPAARRRRDDPVRWRKAASRARPAAAEAAGPAAARRADQPPRRGVGGVARAPPAGVPRHGRRDHPRPVLPRQRGRLDPRARPWARDSVPGQLLGLARAEARPPAERGEAGERAPAHDRPGARVGPAQRERPAEQAEGPPQRLRGAAGPGPQRQARPGADPHSGWAAARRHGRRGQWTTQGLRRPGPDRRPQLQSAAWRDRRRDRPERRREDHAAAADHQAGAAGRRARSSSGRPSSWPTSTRRATRSTPTRTCGRRSRAARTRSSSAIGP